MTFAKKKSVVTPVVAPTAPVKRDDASFYERATPELTDKLWPQHGPSIARTRPFSGCLTHQTTVGKTIKKIMRDVRREGDQTELATKERAWTWLRGLRVAMAHAAARALDERISLDRRHECVTLGRELVARAIAFDKAITANHSFWSGSTWDELWDLDNTDYEAVLATCTLDKAEEVLGLRRADPSPTFRKVGDMQNASAAHQNDVYESVPDDSPNLTTVFFHGDALLAKHRADGVWVIVKRVCEGIGLTEQGQATKLKGKPWAVTTMIVATGPDGKNYEMFAIHIDSLPMWLATIETNRVSEVVRPKLERYQIECARVLRDHFFKPRLASTRPPVAVPALTAEEVATIATVVVEKAIRPVIEAVTGLTKAVAALTEGQKATAPTGGMIGEERAEMFIRQPILELAHEMAAFYRRPKSWRKHMQAIHRLTRKLSHFEQVKGSGWEFLPEAKLGEAQAAIEHQRACFRSFAKDMSPHYDPRQPKLFDASLYDGKSTN